MQVVAIKCLVRTPQSWTEININIDWYLGQRSDKQNGAGIMVQVQCLL